MDARALGAAMGGGPGLLALALVVSGAVGAGPGYEAYGRFSAKAPQCVDIPGDLQLCHDVGYTRMRLPNLLEHDSLAEVKQQAGSWVPLLAKRCHSDTQLFLCALFAPVCLERPIYPCRSLCEVVRDACAPVMESYGFPWPDMLHCAQFPPDHGLCIAVQFGHGQVTAPPVPRLCPQCEVEHKADGMMEQMCSSDFVVKLRIKEVVQEGTERRLVAAPKKKVLKLGPLQRKDTRRMVLHMRNAGACPCPQLDHLGGSFLVLGRKAGGRLLLLAIYRWQKRDPEVKFAVKFMFSYPCPLYHPLLLHSAQHR
ncbi:PREDICTED: secreted frizzled-related protein 5 [Gavialis gangeticus]|uniref:secreted frizzled-related protein 5 n=1 Tax=Gavialis gangeticus TaxID=94835 RepID=UPI00092F1620|nr:PREDICTED: secreted frizzled-related protein 5 [Gavialis gangeticus]